MQLKVGLVRLLMRESDRRGFTLVELTIAIVLTGILAAIALPAYVNQGNRARESTARSTLGSLSRAQQVYRLEHETYAGDFATLQLVVASFDLVQSNYSYDVINANSTGALTQATPQGNTTTELSTFCSLVEGASIEIVDSAC